MMSNLLKQLLEKAHSVLFSYMQRTGLVLCVDDAESKEATDGEEGESEAEEVEQAEEGEESEASGAEEADEIVVTIGDKPAEEDDTKAPEWVRDLRKSHRELQKQHRELQEKLNAVQPTKEAVLGKKPALEEFDYDAEKYEEALEKWHDKKREQEAVERQRQAEQQAVATAWQTTLNTYSKAKAELKVKDYEDAEEVVKDTLSVVQQGIILQGAKNSAVLIYALGKNPKKAKELAAQTDPVKFAFAVADLERDLKIINRKSPPPAEKEVARGTAAISGTVDSTLSRLRAEAEKTGDMSKVIAYKKQLKAKAK